MGFESRRLFGVFLAVLLLGFGFAACGGGDDEEEPPPAATATTTEETVALTTEDLIAEGDSICAEVNAALGSIQSSTADESSKSTQTSDIYDGLAERLGELGTPTDGDPPTEVIAAVQRLGDGSSDTAELQEAAAAYGFSDCADAPVMTEYSPAPSGTEVAPTGTESPESYVPPVTETVPEPEVTAPPTDTGGGVAPDSPDTGGSSTGGGSSPGAGSGGIGPG